MGSRWVVCTELFVWRCNKECHNCVTTDMQNNVIKLRHYCFGPLFFGSKYVKWLHEEEVVLFLIYCSLWDTFASIQFAKDSLFRIYSYNRTHHNGHSVEQTYFISGSSVYHYINGIFFTILTTYFQRQFYKHALSHLANLATCPVFCSVVF